MSEVEWELAKRVCTPKQLAALGHWRTGIGWKRLGFLLGVHPSTAKAHVLAGLDNVERNAAA